MEDASDNLDSTNWAKCQHAIRGSKGRGQTSHFLESGAVRHRILRREICRFGAISVPLRQWRSNGNARMLRKKAASPVLGRTAWPGRAGTKRVADRRGYESLLLRLETMPRSESFERKVLRLIPSSSAHFA